jgi:hypothetical protein
MDILLARFRALSLLGIYDVAELGGGVRIIDGEM